MDFTRAFKLMKCRNENYGTKTNTALHKINRTLLNIYFTQKPLSYTKAPYTEYKQSFNTTQFTRLTLSPSLRSKIRISGLLRHQEW